MSDFIPPEAAADPTYKKYHLTCVTKFIKKSVNEVIKKGDAAVHYERKLVVLLPVESDETTRFFMAWLPSEKSTYHEVVAMLGRPVNMPARLSVHMQLDERLLGKPFGKNYLFVMTKAAEDILVMRPEGSRITLTVMPANEDSLADDSETSQGNYETF